MEGLLECTKHKSKSGIVCWGSSSGGENSLNRNAGRLNKLEQAIKLIGSGIPHVVVAGKDAIAKNESYPLVGRRISHRAGKDIRIAFQKEDIDARPEIDYYTVFEPFVTEYRIWVYRGRHLGTYEKVLDRPELYKRFGRNYHNGWSFQLVKADSIPTEATRIAGDAVSCLDLDFGGVDIGKTPEGLYKVIEVNSAPSVASPERQVLKKLAGHINLWHDNNFPKRRGEGISVQAA